MTGTGASPNRFVPTGDLPRSFDLATTRSLISQRYIEGSAANKKRKLVYACLENQKQEKYALECRAKRAVLDGEIVCLDKKGNSHFRNLLFGRGEPRFYAFDLLPCNGEDLRYFPLPDRKQRLRGVVLHEAERLLYCDHIEERWEHLYRLACKRDLEGCREAKVRSIAARQHQVVQDQESQLLAVGGARGTIRA